MPQVSAPRPMYNRGDAGGAIGTVLFRIDENCEAAVVNNDSIIGGRTAGERDAGGQGAQP